MSHSNRLRWRYFCWRYRCEPGLLVGFVPLSIWTRNLRLGHSRFGVRAVLSSVDALPLQQTEEAFRGRIVRTGSNRAHAAEKLMPLEEALVLVTGELAAAVRVGNHRASICPL